MKHRCYLRTVQPVGWQLRIYVGEEGRQHIVHDVQRFDPEFEYDFGSGAFFGVDTLLFFWVEDFDILAITHEALHIATYMWEKAGANLHVYNNDEVLAYSQGHILDLVLSALEDHYELQDRQ